MNVLVPYMLNENQWVSDLNSIPVLADHAELGIEDRILLHRSRSSLCHWRLVHHSRAGRVSEMLDVSVYS